MISMHTAAFCIVLKQDLWIDLVVIWCFVFRRRYFCNSPAIVCSCRAVAVGFKLLVVRWPNNIYLSCLMKYRVCLLLCLESWVLSDKHCSCGFISFMCSSITVTQTPYIIKTGHLLCFLKTRSWQNKFDLITQTAVTLKRMVCIRISIQGTGPREISHFGLSLLWLTKTWCSHTNDVFCVISTSARVIAQWEISQSHTHNEWVNPWKLNKLIKRHMFKKKKAFMWKMQGREVTKWKGKRQKLQRMYGVHKELDAENVG